MKKHIIVSVLCIILISALFLSKFQISFQREYFYEVSSDSEDVERHEDEEEKNEAQGLDPDIEIL